MKSGTVNFTIGEDFGVLLMNIAQEHLLYNYNPQKALETITGSLRGCPEDLGLQILKGDMVLPVDEDTQEVICVPREEFHTMFPKLELEDWCDKQSKDIEKHALELRDALSRLKIRAPYERIHKTYDYATIMQFVAGNDAVILDELRDLEEVSKIELLFTVTRRFIDNAMKTFKVIDWMRKSYPQEFLHADPDDYRLHVQVVMQEFKKLINGEITVVEDQSVANYMAAIRENDEIIKAGIEPVDIMDNYTAGWLDQDGNYYALNGEIANMLHQEISKALQDKKLIPKYENNNSDHGLINPDAWLEQQGWVKIHDNNINYGGCLNHKLSGYVRDIGMNDIQKKIIYKYIQLCHGGMMRLGWRMTKTSASRFEMIDTEMLNKDYFNFD